MQRNILLFATAALALSLGGCGKRQFAVTGKVTYNGKALAKPNGQIVFVGPDGHQAAAAIGEDGTYTATKVRPGLNQVAIYYPNPGYKRPSRPKGKPEPGERPAMAPLYLTPEPYASPDTSNLKVEVGKGTVFDVDMKGPEIP
jgi:hypothetical protein